MCFKIRGISNYWVLINGFWIRLRFARYRFITYRFVRYTFRFVRYIYPQKTFRLSPRRLEDVFKICLPDVFKHVFKTCLPDVFKTCLQDVLKTSSTWQFFVFQDVFKTCSRRLRKTSSRHLEDVLTNSWKTKNCYDEDVLNTSWHVEDVKTSWTPTNVDSGKLTASNSWQFLNYSLEHD